MIKSRNKPRLVNKKQLTRRRPHRWIFKSLPFPAFWGASGKRFKAHTAVLNSFPHHSTPCKPLNTWELPYTPHWLVFKYPAEEEQSDGRGERPLFCRCVFCWGFCACAGAPMENVSDKRSASVLKMGEKVRFIENIAGNIPCFVLNQWLITPYMRHPMTHICVTPWRIWKIGWFSLRHVRIRSTWQW